MRRNQAAFTLIELLVVIAIISLLVSILLPSLTMAKELARSAACLANTRTLMLAQQFYADDNGVYAAYYKTGHVVTVFLQDPHPYLEKVTNVKKSSPGEDVNFPPLVCPNVPPAKKTGPVGSYGVEGNMYPYGWNGALGVWYYGSAHTNPAWDYTSPEEVHRAADCIGWADAMYCSEEGIFGPGMWWYRYWRPPAPRHGKGTSMPILEPYGPLGAETLAPYPEGSYANGTFLDGHGEQVTLDMIDDNNTFLPQIPWNRHR